jgi:hypothetical protein
LILAGFPLPQWGAGRGAPPDSESFERTSIVCFIMEVYNGSCYCEFNFHLYLYYIIHSLHKTNN